MPSSVFLAGLASFVMLGNVLFLGAYAHGSPPPSESACPAPANPVGNAPRPCEPSITLGDVTVWGTAPLLWKSRLLVPEARHPLEAQARSVALGQDACSASNCDRFDFTLNVPGDYWALNRGGLEFSIRWTPGDRDGSFFSSALTAPDGKRQTGSGAAYARVIRLESAPSGTYSLEVATFGDPATYEGVLQIEPAFDASGPARDLLPNLRPLPPQDLKVALPRWGNVGSGPLLVPIPGPAQEVAALAGIRGCAADEVVEDGARRCLRISTGLGNVGEGALELLLPPEGGIGLTNATPQYYQRIARSDGSERLVAASSEGSAHSTHAHLHYPDLVAMQLFEFDERTGQRGLAVSEGRKQGFCFSDEGLFELGLLGTQPAQGRGPFGTQCLIPDALEGWLMGLDPNWFDMYETYRSGQYVEISGVPDGSYELVVVVDPEGTITESDESDNEASVVIRLVGDDVEVVG